MINSNYTSLSNALDISIKRIKDKFDDKWLITGTDNPDIGSFPLRNPQSGSKYEKVTEPDVHSFTEICICLDGSCAIQIEDIIHDIREGDVCLILPGILHSELPKKDNGYRAIWYTTDLNRTSLHLSGKSAETGSFYTIDGYTARSEYEFNMMLNGMKAEIKDKSTYHIDMVKAYILQLLVASLRKIEESEGNRPDNESWKESVILHIQNYIKANYSRNIRLGEISQEVCISPNYLNTMYKSVTGKTIIQYVEAYKIDNSKELLANTEQSIASIAEQMGYYDQYHFCKIFKKETGYTPTQFRKLKP